ncbi:carbohydrate ABC transporter permease [Acuticoccus mangrovi]|uniref:sn-glycerol-3-phosphate transport system permease protein UgpE n=1 Tax=Acuticoccus mangrovi TaxID=2796142 RepID=A0A934IPM9_9HYPH|nr:carbohydrate ABC transporter permease [Acuticoccus mangrovi]
MGAIPRFATVLFTIAGICVALLFMLPVIWMLTSSLRPNAEIFAHFSPLTWQSIVPETWTLSNIVGLLGTGFGRSLLNSLIVTVITTTLGLVMAIMAGFAVSVLTFPGRNVLFAFFVVGFSVPFDAVAVPLSAQVREVGLTNSFFGLALAGLGNGFAIYLLRQFFLGIPRSLAEAARLDGASWLRVLWSVYLPLAKGPIIAAGLTLFVFQWQAYLWPLLVATDPKMQVGPVALAGLVSLSGVIDFSQMFAGALFLSIVPAGLMLWLQRYFVSSVSRSGMTG